MNLDNSPSFVLDLKLPQGGIRISTAKAMTPQQFEEFCFANPNVTIEREADGTVIIMAPAAPVSGRRENVINADLTYYARKYGGDAFSSATGWTLPDGSVRSPDASYVSSEKLLKYTEEDLRHYSELVPEFVVEILSPSDSLSTTKDKMVNSWIANGVQLAWLFDVDGDTLYIYRIDGSVDEVTPLDKIITGEDVLPGFEFDLRLLS